MRLNYQSIINFLQLFLAGESIFFNNNEAGQFFVLYFCVFCVFRGSFSKQFLVMPRPHPETKERQHKWFAQHIGSPRRGVFITAPHDAAATPGDI